MYRKYNINRWKALSYSTYCCTNASERLAKVFPTMRRHQYHAPAIVNRIYSFLNPLLSVLQRIDNSIANHEYIFFIDAFRQ